VIEGRTMKETVACPLCHLRFDGDTALTDHVQQDHPGPRGARFVEVVRETAHDRRAERRRRARSAVGGMQPPRRRDQHQRRGTVVIDGLDAGGWSTLCCGRSRREDWT
jgi:hypothetical protein